MLFEQTLPSLGHVCNCRKPDQLAVSNCQVRLQCRVLRTALHALVMRSTRTASRFWICFDFLLHSKQQFSSSAAIQKFQVEFMCFCSKNERLQHFSGGLIDMCIFLCPSWSLCLLKSCTFSEPEENCFLEKKHKLYNI